MYSEALWASWASFAQAFSSHAAPKELLLLTYIHQLPKPCSSGQCSFDLVARRSFAVKLICLHGDLGVGLEQLCINARDLGHCDDSFCANKAQLYLSCIRQHSGLCAWPSCTNTHGPGKTSHGSVNTSYGFQQQSAAASVGNIMIMPITMYSKLADPAGYTV